MTSSFLISLVAYLINPSTLSALQDVVPVDGDAELMKFIRSALLSYPSSLSFGEMKAEVQLSQWPLDEKHRRGKDVMRDQASISMTWDGEKAFLEYTLRQESTKGLGGFDYTSHYRRLHERDRITKYAVDSHQCVIGREHEVGIVDAVKIDLRELGFVSPLNWREILGATVVPASNRITRYDVSRRGDDDVVIGLQTKGGHRATIVCSLRYGGNIVEYESIPPKGSGMTASLKWENQPGGVCVLRDLDHKRFFDGKASEPHYHLIVKVLEFTNRRAPDSKFTFQALGVEPGTRIHDISSGMKYNYSPSGGTSLKQQSLDELAKLIGSRGFGSGMK